MWFQWKTFSLEQPVTNTVYIVHCRRLEEKQTEHVWWFIFRLRHCLYFRASTGSMTWMMTLKWSERKQQVWHNQCISPAFACRDCERPMSRQGIECSTFRVTATPTWEIFFILSVKEKVLSVFMRLYLLPCQTVPPTFRSFKTCPGFSIALIWSPSL
jgi:hypothetical protein